jgi:UDP-3-O-[3-hydroxymyristoyl] glucosamine N-acyltransferase
MKFSELVEKLGAASGNPLTADGTQDLEVTGLAAVDEAIPGTLSYIEGAKFAAQIKTTQASVLILPRDGSLQALATERGIAWIEVAEPRLAFAQAIALFYQPYKPVAEIHPSAIIDPTAEIGQDGAISAYVVIQAGAKIGNGVCIHPNVVVYPGAAIGDRTVLHANCVIHERSQIGADCVIHAGAVIGSEGFGFVPVPKGWYKMEQSGMTILEDGVEIGCNSTVDRPAVGETRIARNTKIDNLVQIAHGCQIGQNCAMAAQVGMAGGVKIGNRVILGGQVGIADHVEIGNEVQAGAKAGIISDVPAGRIVMGFPASPYREFLKSATIYKRLPQMHQSLRQLQHQLEQLQIQVQELEATQF